MGQFKVAWHGALGGLPSGIDIESRLELTNRLAHGEMTAK
jgi:hypothetical protein